MQDNTDLLSQFGPDVVEIETRKGPTHVRALSGEGRARYMELMAQYGEKIPIARIAALGWCTASGDLRFDPESDIDIATIAALDGAVLQDVVQALFRTSGLLPDQVESAEKKSEASPSA